MELAEHAGTIKPGHKLTALAGYPLLEQIYAGDRAIVYRGRRDSDRSSVVVKLFRERRPDGPTVARYRASSSLPTRSSASPA